MIINRDELQALDPNGRHCEMCNEHMHKHEWANLDMNGFVTDCNFRYCKCSIDDQLPTIKPGEGMFCGICDKEILFDPTEEVEGTSK